MQLVTNQLTLEGEPDKKRYLVDLIAGRWRILNGDGNNDVDVYGFKVGFLTALYWQFANYSYATVISCLEGCILNA